ncbi:MAG: class I SAM-dependent methyltransferase [Acidobacteriota bacterium]
MDYDWKNDQKTTEICREMGSYPCITSYNAEGNLAQAKKEYQIKSILDLGCGRGNILNCALSADIPIADGVEFFKSHISAARRTLKKFDKSRYKIYQGDIRTWQPKKKYDLIYMFDPICQEESRKPFFDNLMNYLPDEQLIIYIAVDLARTHNLLANHFEHASENSEFPMFKYHKIAVPDRNTFWKDK